MCSKELILVDFFDELFEAAKNSTVGGKSTGILRTVKGPIAEWDRKNRNGRVYSEKLWDKTLSSEYVNEQLSNGTLWGELNHPEKRLEVDMSRVSHRITEMRKIPGSKQVFGKVEILNTPMGNILNTLYETGSIVGYSTRAGGKLIKKGDTTYVDENSYAFVTLDAVPFPSVKSVRLVAEGVSLGEDKEVLPLDVVNMIEEQFKIGSEGIKESIKELLSSMSECYDVSGVNLEVVSEGSESSDTIRMVKTGLELNDKVIKEKKLVEESLQVVNESYKTLKESFDSNAKELEHYKELYRTTNLLLVQEQNKEQDTILEDVEDLKVENSMLRRRLVVLEEGLVKKEKGIDLAVNEAVKELETEVSDLCAKLGAAEKSAADSFSSKVSDLSSVKESYEAEISVLEGLIQEKDGIILEKDKMIESLNSNPKVNEDVERLKEEIVNLQKEVNDYKTKVTESESNLNEYVGISDGLRKQLEKAYSDVSELTAKIDETVKCFESKVDSRVQFLEHQLVSIVSSNYGLSAESVVGDLHENFNVQDVYNVCESYANKKSHIKSVVSVVQESKSVESDPKQERLRSMLKKKK